MMQKEVFRPRERAVIPLPGVAFVPAEGQAQGGGMSADLVARAAMNGAAGKGHGAGGGGQGAGGQQGGGLGAVAYDQRGQPGATAGIGGSVQHAADAPVAHVKGAIGQYGGGQFPAKQGEVVLAASARRLGGPEAFFGGGRQRRADNARGGIIQPLQETEGRGFPGEGRLPEALRREFQAVARASGERAAVQARGFEEGDKITFAGKQAHAGGGRRGGRGRFGAARLDALPLSQTLGGGARASVHAHCAILDAAAGGAQAQALQAHEGAIQPFPGQRGIHA